LKPSNVLLTAEGQPMLLDFHLARQPLAAGARGVLRVGGTPGCMAPEQLRALDACRDGLPVPVGVDGRADVYSLGLLRRAALRPQDPAGVAAPRPSHVPVGLHDILSRCLAPDPARRYPSAERLADALRRQLTHRPLRGVPNRNLPERWAKWRRRRPFAL